MRKSFISAVEQGLNHSQLEITSYTTVLLFQISPEHWENLRAAEHERMGSEAMIVKHLSPPLLPPDQLQSHQSS